jgi:hypothetical protein
VAAASAAGVGLLTGEAGVGKTAALRALTAKLNPHRYQVIYHAETDFVRLDLYRCLAQTLGRAPYAALAGRIQARVRLNPVFERERFARLIEHGFKSAGCTHTLLTDSGMEILRQASQGLPRHAGPPPRWPLRRSRRCALRFLLPARHRLRESLWNTAGRNTGLRLRQPRDVPVADRRPYAARAKCATRAAIRTNCVTKCSRCRTIRPAGR